jgi:hypothetical protein
MDGPKEVEGRTPDQGRPSTNSSHHSKQPTGANYTGQPRQPAFDALVPRTARTCHPGRRAHAWREGFGYGFRDALRLASRHIDDPHVLAILAELAECYDLAGGGGL